jgi:hypothetical protein
MPLDNNRKERKEKKEGREDGFCFTLSRGVGEDRNGKRGRQES